MPSLVCSHVSRMVSGVSCSGGIPITYGAGVDDSRDVARASTLGPVVAID